MSGKPWEIRHGDVRKVLRTFPENHFDGCLTDPPYGLSFMGQRWDYDVPSVNVWTELLRVLKPGAHALIFGGSRTFHRIAVNVEDAGFEIRDVCMWIYGSGFPKSHDISKAIDKRLKVPRTQVVGYKDSGLDKGTGASVSFKGSKGRAANGLIPCLAPATAIRSQWQGQGTALKPAYEPLLLVQKPSPLTVAENAMRWGTGGLAIDASRVGDEERFNGAASSTGMWAGIASGGEDGRPAVGRWPANVVLDEESAKQLDEQSGDRPGMSGGGQHAPGYAGGMFGSIDSSNTARGDFGGASRFFYTAKASRAEREEGLRGMKKGTQGVGALRDGRRSNGEVANIHSTVKPVDLDRYFARLILPPSREGNPRRLIVPFSGSGSEIIGALQAGWDEVVGIEREAEYIEIAKDRIRKGGVMSGLLDKKMRRRERVT